MIAPPRSTDALITMCQLNILPLNNMIQFNLCKLGQQMTHKLLPQPLQNILNADGGKKPIDILQETNTLLIFKNINAAFSTGLFFAKGPRNL